MNLAREVEQGLTLAIYLDLNDSTITGMGFDALAKGQSLVDITYKVLLLWKRKTSKYKDKQVCHFCLFVTFVCLCVFVCQGTIIAGYNL